MDPVLGSLDPRFFFGTVKLKSVFGQHNHDFFPRTERKKRTGTQAKIRHHYTGRVLTAPAFCCTLVAEMLAEHGQFCDVSLLMSHRLSRSVNHR